jgi:hypothetical protein
VFRTITGPYPLRSVCGCVRARRPQRAIFSRYDHSKHEVSMHFITKATYNTAHNHVQFP